VFWGVAGQDRVTKFLRNWAQGLGLEQRFEGVGFQLGGAGF
jgi:hypothetical protein